MIYSIFAETRANSSFGIWLANIGYLTETVVVQPAIRRLGQQVSEKTEGRQREPTGPAFRAVIRAKPKTKLHRKCNWGKIESLLATYLLR
jgi:hypothetical protein